MHQIIQLKPEDDIASIRARIENAELAHVVLVVPRACLALESERGLQLLRRAAEDTGTEIALVAHDDDLRDRAEDLGFPTFNSLAQAQRTRWKMQPLSEAMMQSASGGRLFATRHTLSAAPPEHIAGGGLKPAVIVERFKPWWGSIAALVLASCALCIGAALFVPAAKVRIVPASLALMTTTDVLADPSVAQVNSATRTIPARRVTREISGTAQLQTTTQKQVPNASSTGTVVFTNLRAEETTIPQGTIVKTSAGVPIRFTTTTTATLPAGVGNRAEAPIQAVEPGPAGNVRELAINTIDGSLSIAARVINLKPTVSGSLKSVKVVTADDKKKLEAQLLQQMRQQSVAVLQKELKPNEFIPAEAVLIDPNDAIYDRAVDEPADVLNLRITAEAFALAIDREDLVLIMRALLEKQMQVGYQLLPDGLAADALTGGKYQGIAFRLPVRAVGYATPQIDAGKVSRALQGKSADEAARYLSAALNLAQPPEISISPLGWNQMPWLAFRIAVFVEPQPVAGSR